MAVQTSQVITAANGNLSFTPNGTGQLIASPLAGGGNQSVGVDNAGELQFFSPAQLTTGTPLATSELMLDIAGTVNKASVQDIVDASDAINLAGLSVTQNAATAASIGSLAYNNTTGVFTYEPPSLTGLNGISLTGLSVTQNATTATSTGTLSYNNTNGVFTYRPPSLDGLGGIGFTDLSITTDTTKTQAGALAYNNTTGVFTYTPVEYDNGTSSLTGLTLTGPTFKIDVSVLPDRP